MSEGPQDSGSQRRFNPYGRPLNRREERNRKGGRGGGGGNGSGGGNRYGGRSGGGGGGSDGSRKNWFKMTIPYGKKYDKDWLLSSLQSCSVPFHAVHYHTDGNKAQFYIEDSAIANALFKASRKITDKDGYKVTVIMNSCPPPSLIYTDLKAADLEHLKQCMAKRFDGSQQALDLNNIRVDPDLVSQNIEVTLNRRNSMLAVIKIIEENIPELICLNLSNNRLYRLDDLADIVNKVPNLKILNLSHNELKTERELDKLKGLKLVELSLEGNPLCGHYKIQADYVRLVFSAIYCQKNTIHKESVNGSITSVQKTPRKHDNHYISIRNRYNRYIYSVLNVSDLRVEVHFAFDLFWRNSNSLAGESLM
uniref:Nuclear RNA export factor 1 n=1 Tax=Cyprinus carpio TaxID=7962 RepID=A0A8C2JU95_CYPCA